MRDSHYKNRLIINEVEQRLRESAHGEPSINVAPDRRYLGQFSDKIQCAIERPKIDDAKAGCFVLVIGRLLVEFILCFRMNFNVHPANARKRRPSPPRQRGF